LYWSKIIEEFIAYRTEPSNTWRQRWEWEKFFDISRRLATRWKRAKDFQTKKTFSPPSYNKAPIAQEVRKMWTNPSPDYNDF
jgi:hypothetical protein